MDEKELFKTFDMLIKVKKLTKVSEKLNITYKELIKRIDFLENNFKTKLFYNMSGFVILSDDGIKLYNYYKTHGKFIINIKIGIVSNYSFIIPLFDYFNKHYPNTVIKTELSNLDILINMLINNDIDIIITDFKVKNDNFKCKSIKNIEDSLFANKSLKNCIADYPLIYCKNNIKIINKNPYITVSTNKILFDKIKDGIGIGYINKLYVLDDLTNGFFKLNKNITKNKGYILYNNENQFVEIIKKINLS